MTDLPEWVRADLEAAVRIAAGRESSGEPLDDHLYRDWYLRRPELEGIGPEPPPLLALNLTGALQASHAADGRWEPGWTVARVSSRGRVAVARNGQQRVLDRIDVVPVDPARAALPLRPGDEVQATARVDGISADGGFWVTFGEGWEDPPAGSSVRFYWNVAGAGAPELVHRMTGELAAAGVPYLFKLPVHAGAYCRADAAVLYLAAGVVEAATPVLRAVHERVAAALRPPAPRLAFRLAPGVATADDPPSGESFGQHRCRLAGEALAGLDGSKGGKPADRIAARFEAEGIDPRRPYLNPGSTRAVVAWS